jgi:membrane-anchored protein YejM (alkaline phosphatase superfamily)
MNKNNEQSKADPLNDIMADFDTELREIRTAEKLTVELSELKTMLETVEVINEIQAEQIEVLEKSEQQARKEAQEVRTENERLTRLNAMLLKAVTEAEKETSEASATANKFKRLYLEAISDLDGLAGALENLRNETHSRKIKLIKGRN